MPSIIWLFDPRLDLDAATWSMEVVDGAGRRTLTLDDVTGASGRRGFWWVKWVARVEVDTTPWWLQSPYPTQ